MSNIKCQCRWEFDVFSILLLKRYLPACLLWFNLAFLVLVARKEQIWSKKQTGWIVSFKILNGHVFPLQKSKLAFVPDVIISQNWGAVQGVLGVHGCGTLVNSRFPHRPISPQLSTSALAVNVLLCTFLLFFLSFSFWFKEVILAKCKIKQVIGPIILFFWGQQLPECRSILAFSVFWEL